MKNTINFYQIRKTTTAQPAKRTNYVNSIIYKEINGYLNNPASKNKNNRESKETLLSKQRKSKDQLNSKKNSFNQLATKTSKTNISNIDLYSLHLKLTDNFLIDTQEETRLQINETKNLQYQKQKKQLKQKNMDILKRGSKNMAAWEGIENVRIQKSLFSYLYIIGKGGFGKVWKVQHKKTKNQYAMKEMLKSIVMTKKSVQSVMNERVLLSQFISPFIVNMHFAFQDRDTLYLVLDLMEGGDLRHHIGNRSFNEIQSKFFVACIILGLQDLQKNNIIHRDIKPQNLVLDARGYIRITDLGIARIHKPNNSCDTSGTPGYMYSAPQVICRMNHSFVSDYFALGVITYELMTGKRPYNGRSRNQIRDLMISKQVQLKHNDIPEEWSYEAADFVNKLIQRKPENRLGANKFQELKNHDWLSGINWDKLRSKEIQSPFVPMMKKSNFDQDQQITIQDQQQAEMIEKNSLLLRRSEFQELFNSYYYSVAQSANMEITNLDQIQKDKKDSSNKRVISAYRKSTQSDKQTKASQILPDKKYSYNQHNPSIPKRIIELQPQKSQKTRQYQQLVQNMSKQKKRSINYQKAFFR